jgi:hypothetical protein
MLGHILSFAIPSAPDNTVGSIRRMGGGGWGEEVRGGGWVVVGGGGGVGAGHH